MPWTKVQADEAGRPGTFGGTSTATRELSYRDAIREALMQALERDKRVFLIGEGIDDPGGVFGTTVGLADRFGRDRVMDMPIAENALTGVVNGAAMTGMHPVLIHMRVDFLPMAMDQMVNHTAKWSYMTAGRVKVPLTIRAIVGRGWGSAAQHSQSLQAMFTHVPGLQVLLPASPYDAKGMLLAAIAGDRPTLIIEHRWLYDQKEGVPEEPYFVPSGKALVRRPGKDVTIAAASYMVHESLRAAAELERAGISAEVLDLRSAQPFDEQAVIESVRRTGRLIAADTGWKLCGLAAEIAAVAAEHCHASLKAPVKRICLPAAPTPAAHSLEKAYYPSHETIIAAAKELIKQP